MNLKELVKDLREDEGVVPCPYVDSVGKATIGIGHNTDDNPLTDEMMEFILLCDLRECVEDLVNFPFWAIANDARRNALLNLRFNLGPSRFRSFENAIHFANMGMWDESADEWKDSKWYGQVGVRGPKVVEQVRNGEFR